MISMYKPVVLKLARAVTQIIIYPLYTALLSDWRVSDSSHLAHLRERTCELDIGTFLHCKDAEICFVGLVCGIAEAAE